MDALAGTEEISGLGVRHLKRFWSRLAANHHNADSIDWMNDNTLLCGLRVGLRETMQFLYEKRPALAEFESWILERNGGCIDPVRIARINLGLSGGVPEFPPEMAGDPAISAEDLAFWDENGYVILHDAVSPANCEAAAQAIYEFLGMDPERPETWYGGRQGHSIWIPLMHHPAIWANRDSPRIYRAFSQLWKRPDMWCSVDQAGMNPPERPGWQFPGPHLHWDVSVALPIPFGVQGILYLTDTAPDQGAFTCVPGFHRKIEEWLEGLPEGADPGAQDLAGLGATPIAGRAGDLVIWHQALPHGSSPNRAEVPRVAQYIKMAPSQWEQNPVWK
jgi:hypothetical protein